jgi:hypothetical protein
LSRVTVIEDTAALRPATGLDAGARELMLQVVFGLGVTPSQTVAIFFRDRFGSLQDYYAGLAVIDGEVAAWNLRQRVDSARIDAEFPLTLSPSISPLDASALCLLMSMPARDFRTAIGDLVRQAQRPDGPADRITRICRARGIPYAFDPLHGFQFIGDQEVEARAIRPALSALGDVRFSGGVRSDFNSAREELAEGTPAALSKSVHQAACAVESAMKVILDHRHVSYDERATAQALFDALVLDGLPRYMERTVLAPMTPRNRKGGHGPGAVPHDVSDAEAEAVLASCAVAVRYLHSLLP